jgi:hypothetical protein
MKTFIACIAAIATSFAWAGGSDLPVTIESLEFRGASYTLVVVPAELSRTIRTWAGALGLLFMESMDTCTVRF